MMSAELRVKEVKAAGPDCTLSLVLKTFHEELASVLRKDFNTCIQHKIFPSQKAAHSLPADSCRHLTVQPKGCLPGGYGPENWPNSTVIALNQILHSWHEALNNNYKMDNHALLSYFH